MVIVLNVKVVVKKKPGKIPDLTVRDIGEYVSLISKYRVSAVKEDDAMNRLINDLCAPDRRTE